MKKLLHVLTLSVLFSGNISCVEEESFSLSSSLSSIDLRYIAPAMIGIIAFFYFKIFHKHDQYKPCKSKLSDLELEVFHNFTSLHRACENGDLEKVQSLVTTANINQKCYTDYNQKGYDYDKCYHTPLILACKNGHTSVVQFLSSCPEVNPNQTVGGGGKDTALHIACEKGNKEMVRALLSCKQLDPNLKNYRCGQCWPSPEFEKTPIEIAMNAGRKDIVHLLLTHNKIDPTPALVIACGKNDKEMFDTLIAHKNMKFNNNDALCAASKVGNVYMVQKLLELNVNDCMKINQVKWDSRKGVNPLRIACREGSQSKDGNFVEIVRMLCEHSFVDAKESYADKYFCESYSTAMWLAVPNLKILALLPPDNINKRCCIDGQSHGSFSDTDSPLHCAAIKGDIPCVLWLLENGADIYMKDSRGTTPFTEACGRASQRGGGDYLKLISAWLDWQYKHENQKFSEKTKALLSRCLYDSICSSEQQTSSTIVCFYRYLRDLSIGCNANDNVIQKLLLRYGAALHAKIKKGSREDEYSSSMLQAARYNVPILNFFIDSCGGDYIRQDSDCNTPFFKAFMSKQIMHPNQLNFFNKFNEDEKRDFITRELRIVAKFTIGNIAGRSFYRNPYNINSHSETIKKSINTFNSFVTLCFKSVAVDTGIHKELLNFAYGKKETSCLWKGEEATEKDEFHKIPAFAILPHIQVMEPKHKRDQKLAQFYASDPMKYYSMSKESKDKMKSALSC